MRDLLTRALQPVVLRPSARTTPSRERHQEYSADTGISEGQIDMGPEGDTLRELLRVAERVARLGGETTLDFFHKELQTERKPDGTLVTAADRESERVMREALASWCPDHGILGEEFGEVTGKSPFRWILDPLDGTISFVRGSPMFGVIVGLQNEGQMVAGVVHMPALRETVAAATGVGCFWNNHPCQVSSIAAIEDSLLLVTDDQVMRTVLPGYARLAERAAIVRTWGDCYGPLMVATGRAEIFIDGGLDLTDIGALHPILTEAGGTVTDWYGQRTLLAETVVATNSRVNVEFLWNSETK